MYAYCVREFSKKIYAKTKLFQCISKSKNASVLLISSAKVGTLSQRDMGLKIAILGFLVISWNFL